jgi:predicted nucleic acid-binding protein
MVSDSQDLQILQDAYSVKADFLITKNTKDFNVEAVSQYLHIAIVPSIP